MIRRMHIEFEWSRLEDLSALQLHAIVQARESVFVVEQQCPYQEVDRMDLQAWHLCLRADGQLAAYARVVDPGVKYAAPSIGRVLTLPAFRGLALGKALMAEAMCGIEQRFPGLGIQISAQVYLQNFYAALGFVPTSALYDEDGIPHLDMHKSAILT